MADLLFFVFATVAIGSAIGVVVARNPVGSLMSMVATLAAVAGIFVLLEAHFLAAVQVIVYAGAIMVLFLFVIMLLNLGDQSATDMKGWFGRVVGLALGVFVMVELWVITKVVPVDQIRLPAGELNRMTVDEGAIAPVAQALYTTYLLPFLLTAILLLAAIAGAVVLAKREV